MGPRQFGRREFTQCPTALVHPPPPIGIQLLEEWGRAEWWRRPFALNIQQQEGGAETYLLGTRGQA